ncbi:alpha/beta-hydrolase [Clathrospora elynae]|uniref:Alpha/beta-hydrolase n=1 Tax=Clathrospora elynae TaxID=706981 RepID=A0A6A5SWJ3_9PLEO|nr:alpha/beta-hydrolase [Clathrospora elynae]
MMKSWIDGLDDAAAPVKPPRTQVQWRALSATFVTLVCLAALNTIFPGLKNRDFAFLDHESAPRSRYTAFEWSEITASEDLKFHKCFDGFECAKLSLPLDYFNGSYPNDTVSIAIAKLPAKVPVDDPRYGGPILLNPGGPGGPGVSFVLVVAKPLQSIVDSNVDPWCASDETKYFDLIGFDPRGIGLTEPAAQCMPDLPSSWSWNLREDNEGIIGSSDAALGRLWSMTHAFGTSCKQAEDAVDGPDIMQYMSTASVARDMLEIIEKHAGYVAKEVARLSAQKADKRLGYHEIAYTPGEAKLQYWGFSYGSYLGSTFASMFPNRVGRIVLDGIVSSYDYNHSLGNGSLADTEKAAKSFYTFCHHAGPETCALTTANSTAGDIEERVQRIIKSIYHNPLPINSPEGPDIFTWSDLKILIFSSTYQPTLMFAYVAEILAAIEVGGGDIIDDLVSNYRSLHVYSCPANGSKNSNPSPSLGVALIAILCGDGLDQGHTTLDDFIEYWKFLEELSPTSGSYWSMLLMRCAAWKIRASYSFQGPFGGDTSHPVLFVSNTADPVTPLRSGRYMHGLFPSSGLLVGDHAGHSSISAVNPCTFSYIRAYFQTGALPPPGTICVPPPSSYSLNSTDPKSPFYDPSLGSANVVTLQSKDFEAVQLRLYHAALKLQRVVAESDVFGFQNLPGGSKARNAMQIAASGRW